MHFATPVPPAPARRLRRMAAFGAVLAVSVGLAACSTGTDGDTAVEDFEPVVFNIAHTMTEANPAAQTVVEVADRIAERTGGDVTFEIFPNSELGATTETVEQLSLGEPVISYLDAATASTFGVDEFAMLGSPFLITEFDEVTRIVESDLFAGWSDELADTTNIRILALNWLAGPRNIIGPDPYEQPEDLAGVLIRIPPLPTWEALFGASLGTVPVTVASSEVYTAMQQGVVSAAEYDTPSIRDYGLYEINKYVTLTGHFNLFLGFAIAEDQFQALPAEYQQIILEEFAAGGAQASELANELAAEAQAEMEAEGVTFVEADIQAYREASEAFYAAFPEWDADVLAELLSLRDGS